MRIDGHREQRVGVVGGDAALPPPRGPQHVIRAMPSELPQPRQKAVGVAQLAQIAPGRQEHVLRDIPAQFGVAHDREGNGTDDRTRVVDEGGKRLAIAARGGGHVRRQGEGRLRLHQSAPRFGQCAARNSSSAANRNAGSSSMMKCLRLSGHHDTGARQAATPGPRQPVRHRRPHRLRCGTERANQQSAGAVICRHVRAQVRRRSAPPPRSRPSSRPTSPPTPLRGFHVRRVP